MHNQIVTLYGYKHYNQSLIHTAVAPGYIEKIKQGDPLKKKKKKKSSSTLTFPLVAYEIGMNVNITVPKSLSLKLSFQINSEYKRSPSTELICSNPHFLLQPPVKKNISSTCSNFFD